MHMEAFSKAAQKPVKQGLKQRLRHIFGRAAQAPIGSGNKFLEAVMHERPDLKGQTAYFPEQGCFGYTVFIGNEVFKGPRSAGLAKSFDHEPDALQELEGKGLPVPQVTCRGKQAFFYGMTRLEGVTFESVQKKMSEAELQGLAEEVTDFMIDMAQKLPRKNGLYAMQGDLREPNILVDPVSKKLTGIIDFGMACNVTKDALKPRFVTDEHFRALLNTALDRKKAALPDSPQGVKSAYAKADASLASLF